MMYGNHAAYMTMNRAAYGDVPAAMMANGQAGYYGQPGNPLSSVGNLISPILYTPPARTRVTFYGLQPESSTFMGSVGGFFGMDDPSRSQMAATHAFQSGSDLGERIGGGMVTAGATVGGLALGAVASPVVSAMARSAVAAVAGSGMVGGAAAGMAGFMGGALVAPMAGLALAQGVTTAVNERREMGNFLEFQSSRFTGAGSAMGDQRGMGMSRSARMDFTEFARGMDIKDKFMDMGDLQTVLEQGTSKGLFSGAGGDIESFKKKFKDVTEAVKLVTRTLGQTLEEGLSTLKELKTIGVDPSQAGQMITQAEGMGRVAGKSASEMLQVGMQGASIFRGTGVEMSIGAQANMMNLASVRSARDAKMLSEESIMQAGGEEALATRMTASGLAFAQSGTGRGLLAAFTQGGQFNAQSFMQNVAAGGGDIRQLGLQAARNVSSPADLIRLQANQEGMVSEMGKMFGGQGLQIAQMNSAMANASLLSETTGVGMQDAFRASLKSQGLSDQEVQARMSQITNAGGNFSSMQAGVGQTRNNQIIEEASRNFVFNRAGAAIGDFFKRGLDVVAEPANRMINSIQEGLVSFKEEQMYGVQRASMRGVDTTTPTFVTADELSAKSGGSINLDKGGLLGTTIGEKLADLAGGGAFAGLGVSGDSLYRGIGTKGKRGTDVRLDGTFYITEEKLDKLKEQTANSQINFAEASAMKERGAFKDLDMPNLGAMVASGKLDSVSGVDDLISKVYGKGKNQGNISKAQYASLVESFQGTSMQKVLDDARGAGATVQEASRAVEISKMQTGQKMYEEGMGGLKDQLGGDITGEGAAKLAAARRASEAGNSELAEKYYSEATMSISKSSGKDFASVSKFVRNAQAGRLDSSLDNISIGRATMMKAQEAIGSDEISSLIQKDLSSKEMDNVDKGTRDQLQGVALKISQSGSLTALSGEDLKILGKGGKASQSLVHKIQNLKAAEDEFKGKDLSEVGQGDLRKTLNNVLGDKGAQSAIDQISTGQIKDFSQISNMAKSQFAKDLAGKDFASAASTGSAEKGRESAAQLAQTQTSINMQVLTAMEALARRIK